MNACARVLVGVDGSAASDAAVCWAASEARDRNAELIVVHAVATTSLGLWLTTAAVRDTLRAAGQPCIDRAIHIARAAEPGIRIRGRVLIGSPTRILQVMSRACDLVVVGRTGRSALGRLWFGSVTWRLFATAACPVLSVPEGCDGVAARVVLGSHRSPQTSAFAEAEAQRMRCPCVRTPWSGATLAAGCGPKDVLVVGEHRHGPGGLVPLDADVAAALHAALGPVAVVPEPARTADPVGTQAAAAAATAYR